MYAKLIVKREDEQRECLFEGNKVYHHPDPSGSVHFEMFDGNEQVCEWLLDESCKVYVTNSNGKTIEVICGTRPPKQ